MKGGRSKEALLPRVIAPVVSVLRNSILLGASDQLARFDIDTLCSKVKSSNVSLGIFTYSPLVMISEPAPTPAPAPAPIAAPLPPPAIAPMMLPIAAPPTVLFAVLAPLDLPVNS